MTEDGHQVRFSKRERQIADLVGDGQSYKQIGATLEIDPSTVRSHVVRMAKKCDLEGDRALEPRMEVFKHVWFERWRADNFRVPRTEPG